jgi:catechol 2,3-dioxygenase-like lactoylglutathione lyase family enzyme
MSGFLHLLVPRERDIGIAARFYRALGLALECHRHGKGPLHYATTGPSPVLEIYPLKSDVELPVPVRLGFSVASIGQIMASLRADGVVIFSEPREFPWGLRLAVEDPDGTAVERVESAPA